MAISGATVIFLFYFFLFDNLSGDYTITPVNFIYFNHLILRMGKRKRGSTPLAKKETGLKHKEFWIGLAIVFLLSAVAIFSSLDSKVTGYAIVLPISFVQEGKQVSYETRGDVPGIKTVTIEAKGVIKQDRITIAWDGSIPFDGVAYSKFSVKSDHPESVGEVTFTLKIKEEDLTRVKLAPEDVKLYFEGTELSTTLTSTDRGYIYYSTSAGGLGNYVIGKATVVRTPPQLVPEIVEAEETPTETTAEEKAIEAYEQQPALVGEAGAQATEPKVGFWAKIVQFFRNLFG